VKTLESNERLVFDYRTIRLIIGLIAFAFPWIVSFLAHEIPSSISWSYYTDGRDLFVGFLFVIGAFLICYKGHPTDLDVNEVESFWHWLNQFWKGAINFRIAEKKLEENLVSSIGGIAAGLTALCPTSYCIEKNCPSNLASMIHDVGALILFSTTVYFCLVAFMDQAKSKVKADEQLPGKSGFTCKKQRVVFYKICGWGIAVIMVGLVVVTHMHLDFINDITFWAEALALTLFGSAWMVASHLLPFFTDVQEQHTLFEKREPEQSAGDWQSLSRPS
jgi:hypothetical protein